MIPNTQTEKDKLIEYYRQKVGPKTAIMIADIIIKDRRHIVEPLVKLHHEDTMDNLFWMTLMAEAINQTLLNAGIGEDNDRT